MNHGDDAATCGTPTPKISVGEGAVGEGAVCNEMVRALCHKGVDMTPVLVSLSKTPFTETFKMAVAHTGADADGALEDVIWESIGNAVVLKQREIVVACVSRFPGAADFALERAAATGDVELMSQCCALGADDAVCFLTGRGRQDITRPMIAAASGGFMRIVEILLKVREPLLEAMPGMLFVQAGAIAAGNGHRAVAVRLRNLSSAGGWGVIDAMLMHADGGRVIRNVVIMINRGTPAVDIVAFIRS